MNKKIWLAAICIAMVSCCIAVEREIKRPHKGFEEEVNIIGYEELWVCERGGIGPWGPIYFFDMDGDGKKEIVVGYYLLGSNGNILWEKEFDGSIENFFGDFEKERSFFIIDKGRYGRGELCLLYLDTWEEKCIYTTSTNIFNVILQEDTILVNEGNRRLVLMDFEGNKLAVFIPENYGVDEVDDVLVHDNLYICTVVKDLFTESVAVLDKDLNLFWKHEIESRYNFCVAENGKEIFVWELKENMIRKEYLYTFDMKGNLKQKIEFKTHAPSHSCTNPFYVGDLDNDGIDEIVASAGVYNVDGTERWSYDIFVESALRDMSPLVYVEDLDGDGTKEIIAASPDILNFPEDEVILLVFDAEGNVLFNKILFTDGKTSNGIGDLYVEDLDGDGTKEIIVMYDTYEDRGEESVHTCRLVVFGSKES